ncbi:hypothetical protein PG988_010193 [Apiospora saccharicola]
MNTEPYPPATDASGTVTTFVPLTTTFTALPSCSTQFRQNGPSLVAYDPGYGLDIDTRVGGGRCVPGPVTTWWEQARLGFNDDNGRHTAASLGPMTCPDGWPTLVSSSKNEKSTVALCCPSGYFLAGGVKGSITGDCQSTVQSGDVLTYAATSDGSSWYTTTSTMTAVSYIGAIAVVGWNIQQESTTTGSITTGPPTSTSISTSTSAAPQGSQGHGQQQQPVGESPSSSSQARTIGLSVGLSLGAVALVLAVVLLLLLRRRRRTRSSPSERPDGPVVDATAAPPVEQPPWKAELPAALGEELGIITRRGGPASFRTGLISSLWPNWTGTGSDEIETWDSRDAIAAMGSSDPAVVPCNGWGAAYF